MTSRLRLASFYSAIVFGFCAPLPAVEPGLRLDPGKSDGVLHVVLHDVGTPGMDRSNPVWQSRLETGWTLQSIALDPSENPSEHAKKVAALVSELDAQRGPFRLRMIQAEGALGPVAVELLENPATAAEIHGALIFDARLDPSAVSARPLRPLFMISHRDQLDGPLAYLAAASASFAYPSVAVHSVERPAAAGLLPAELQRSLMFFFNWLSGEVPPRLGSATFDPPGPVGTGTLADGAITAKVIRLEPDFGNLELDLSLGALAALGVKMGDRVGIRAGGQVRIARVVDRFAGVARGDWAVVAIPSGELRVAVFMDNASKNLGVGIGETIELVPVKAD